MTQAAGAVKPSINATPCFFRLECALAETRLDLIVHTLYVLALPVQEP